MGVSSGLAESRARALHRNAIKTGSAYSEMRAMLSDLPANTRDQLRASYADADDAAAAAAAAAAEVAAAGRRLFFSCLSTLWCVMKVDNGRWGDREKVSWLLTTVARQSCDWWRVGHSLLTFQWLIQLAHSLPGLQHRNTLMLVTLHTLLVALPVDRGDFGDTLQWEQQLTMCYFVLLSRNLCSSLAIPLPLSLTLSQGADTYVLARWRRSKMFMLSLTGTHTGRADNPKMTPHMQTVNGNGRPLLLILLVVAS